MDHRAHQAGWLPEDWHVRLPTEEEWEKAARGGGMLPEPALARAISTGVWSHDTPALRANPDARREYPWIGALDPEKANTRETGIGETSAFGCFAGGVGPYSHLDLSGNVWEWQENWYDKDRDSKSLRGGSWNYNRRDARCSYRNSAAPDGWYYGFGFRPLARFLNC